jgi:hypothetical protein
MLDDETFEVEFVTTEGRAFTVLTLTEYQING